MLRIYGAKIITHNVKALEGQAFIIIFNTHEAITNAYNHLPFISVDCV